MNSRTLALCCLAASVSAIAAVPHYGEETTQDEPLLLTPLIKAGRYTDARKLSVVDLNGTEMGNSGYFTVDSADPNIINNLFFWYQPCKDGCDAATAPLLIWLQGGPGGPGTFGATSEIGNWWTDEKGNYHDRCFSWCRTNNCIFVDQPVWTGFSFQTTRDGKPVEDKDILFTNSSHLATMQVFELMEQFMTIFPELHSAPLYITGESYGGLYIPNLAMNIVKNDERAKAAGINLKGLAAGDPAINWLYQAPTYASTLYGMGVVMLDERAALEKLFAESVEHWRHEDPAQCRAGFDVWNTIWNDNGALPGPSGYEKLTGSANTANVLMGGTPMEWAGIGAFFARHSVHRAFHVEGAPKPTNLSDVGIRLYNAFVDSGDFCKPTSPLYASLFVEAGLEMMIYSSTADPLLGPPTTEAAVMSILDAAKALGAKGDAFRNAFLSASKSVWRAKVTDQQVAGYAKCAQVSADSPRFCYSVVRNAGHEAPAYQPRSNYDLIDRFLYRRPWDKAGDDTKLLTCGQCGGVGPFAGFALPECNH